MEVSDKMIQKKKYATKNPMLQWLHKIYETTQKQYNNS